MASTYSPNLRLELIGTGEQQGTWGSTTNTNLGTLLEEAIGGYTSVTVSNVGDTTLTTNNGSADQSRNMVINLTGTISAARNVLCPAIEKLYVVKNATTGGFDVTFKVNGRISGVTIPNGETYFLYVDGVDAQKIVGNVASTNTTNTFTENQIIQVTDNTDAALRITQLGTGNALLVEDSANPDGTPTIITQSGQIVTGYTATVNTDNSYGGQITPRIQTHGTVTDNAALAATLWSASGAASQLILSKSRGAAIGTNAVVQSGDDLGAVAFNGDDGASLIVAAAITASVDGTPGTNDMPGRIAFATTADGASVPTERMRINSLGSVNIGTATNPESVLQITGSTSPTAQMIGSISGTTLTVSGVTSGSVAVGDRVFIGTAGLDYNTYITALGTGTGGVGTYTINNTATVAGGTTLLFYPSRVNNITLFETDTTSVANQPMGGIEWYGSDSSTPGAGVKAYIATISESSTPDTAILFGTSDNVASTQAVERMRIASDGKVGIGTNAADALLSVNGVASFGDGSASAPSITNFGDLNTGMWFPAADTIAWSANGSEHMRLTSTGNLGIGSSSLASTSLRVSSSITGGTSAQAVRADSAIQSDVTSGAVYYLSSASTAAASFTVSALSHFYAIENSIGAGSSVTNQYGFRADAGLIGATNNYSFFAANNAAVTSGKTAYNYYASSNIATGGGTAWAFYSAGTASNYFAGQVQLGAGSVGTPSLGAFGDTNTGMWFPAADTVALSTGGSERVRVNSSGNVGVGTSDLTSGSRLVINNTASASATSIALLSGGTFNGEMGLGVLTGFGDGVGLNARGASGTVVLGTNNTERVRVTSAGRVGIGTTTPACLLDVAGGIQTSSTAVTSPAATDGNIFSGNYTPTLTGVTNVAASTAYLSQYMRVGNIVTVSGRISIDPTNPVLTEIRMSLPITASFNAQSRCGGTFARGGATTGNCGSISANTANNDAFFAITPSVDTNQDYWFSFTYTLGI